MDAANAILLMVVVAAVCAVVIVRLSPALMRQLADWLNARADAECWFAERHLEYVKAREERES